MGPSDLGGSVVTIITMDALARSRRTFELDRLRSCVATTGSQILCDRLSFCFRRRHLVHESPYMAGELHTSLSHQHVADREPPLGYLPSRLKKTCLAVFDPELSVE